ncbi:hypothetical protein GCM10009556_085410 [Acrocarpospora pleiomorpha]
MDGLADMIRLVAATPSKPGIRKSISTTSGTVSSTSRTASDPFAASPTTSISGAESNNIRNPIRTKC